MLRDNLKAGGDNGSSVPSFCTKKDQKLVWIIGSLLIVLGSLLPDPVSLFLIPFNEIKDSEAWKAIKQQTVGNQIIF